MQELGLALGLATGLAIASGIMTIANYCMLRRTTQALGLARLVRDDAIRDTLSHGEGCCSPATAPHQSDS